jgi:hypothetical protein
MCLAPWEVAAVTLTHSCTWPSNLKQSSDSSGTITVPPWCRGGPACPQVLPPSPAMNPLHCTRCTTLIILTQLPPTARPSGQALHARGVDGTGTEAGAGAGAGTQAVWGGSDCPGPADSSATRGPRWDALSSLPPLQPSPAADVAASNSSVECTFLTSGRTHVPHVSIVQL